jgi:uncharacterized protein (DUF1330 family)
MVVVAILRVRQAFVEQFREYERRVVTIMQNHGGEIERTVIVPAGDDETFREIHIMRFPDQNSFGAYHADPARRALEAMREAAIIETEILFGEDGSVDRS